MDIARSFPAGSARKREKPENFIYLRLVDKRELTKNRS